jgi:hypothetical protein
LSQIPHLSPSKVARNLFGINDPSYYVLSAGVTSLVTTASHRIGWQILLLVLPVMYGVYRSYRIYFGGGETTVRPVALAKAAGARGFSLIEDFVSSSPAAHLQGRTDQIDRFGIRYKEE